MKKAFFKSLMFIMTIMGILLCAQAFANPASMDPSFDTKLPLGFNGPVRTITTQRDGKIIVGGEFTAYK
jgi:hypothetical protein